MWLMDYRKDTHLYRFESKQKISLPMESKAEDTLKKLRLNKDTSGRMRFSDSLSESCALDGSDSEDSATSGPSSPSAALHSLRCRRCKGLFTKMKRQGPSRKKQRDNDPASLSCDEWMLNKTWQPQRRLHFRGRLWVHLKRIRLQGAKQADAGMANKAWLRCSRPHVFLQRNLRRCKTMLGKTSKSKAKPVHQQGNRAWPRGKTQRQKKRKSSEKDDISEHLSPLDLTITSDDKPPANNTTHHDGLQRLEKVLKKQCVCDVSGFMDVQANGSGLEGTRRVLKFNTPPTVVLTETQNPKHSYPGAKLHERQADFTAKDGDRPRHLDDALNDDVFRTPLDLSVDLKISRKSKSSRPYGTRKDSFRAMLAALPHGHNQIIKESHH